MRITLPISEASRTIVGWQRQVPYALAQALNATAKAARERVAGSLGKTFTIRSNWVSKGLRARFATKRDLTAVVGQMDPFMALQELGGTKESKDHAQAVPIGPGGPSPAFRGPGGRGKTLRGRWPSALPGTFTIHTKAGEDLVLQRTERYRSKRQGKGGFTIVRADRVRVIYRLKQKVRIKARWGFRAKVALAVGDLLGQLFAAELAGAIRTAR